MRSTLLNTQELVALPLQALWAVAMALPVEVRSWLRKASKQGLPAASCVSIKTQ